MADDTDLANDGAPVHGAHPDGADRAVRARWSTRARPTRVMRGALAGAGVAAIVLAVAWGMRERIATGLIDRELAALRLPARYRVISAGLGREVLSDIVVGNPGHPDLVIDRAEIAVGYGFGGPRIERIVLVRPRLYGRLITAPADGSRLSLGSLDTLVYAPSSNPASNPASGPARLPDWSVTLVGGRARIDSEFGTLGISLAGQGRLSDGFSGALAVVVPVARLLPQCTLAHTLLTGALTTRAGRWQFTGPVQMDKGRCGGAAMGAGKIDLVAAGDAALTDITLGGKLALGRIDLGRQLTLGGLGGQAGLRWLTGKADQAAGSVAGRMTLVARGLATPGARIGQLQLDGAVHARPDTGRSARTPRGAAMRLDFRGDCSGRALSRGPLLMAAMARLRGTVAGTPLAALLDRAGAALTRDEPASTFDGSVGLHGDAAGWRIAVPSLAWRGGQSGHTLARVDHFALIRQAGRPIGLTGNFTTGGRDLPVIGGTVTAPAASGAIAATRIHLTMARYAAGLSQLAVPDLNVVAIANGTLSFNGKVAVSGPLGQGSITHLVSSVDGTLGQGGALALFGHCTAPSFDRLRYGALDLGGGTIRLCPAGGAIVRSTGAGTIVAATIPAFSVQGSAGDAPITIRAKSAHIAWPGTSGITGVDIALASGRQATPDHLHLDTVTIAQPRSGGAPAGAFTGGTVILAASPADFSAARGTWQIAPGRPILYGGAFVATDRVSPARFAPVAVRDVTMTLANDALDATAQMAVAAPGADQKSIDLGTMAVHHDLRSGTGHADVAIPGLTFRDPAGPARADTDHAADRGKANATPIQPSDLSPLAKGVIAAVGGTVKGHARVGWNTHATGGGLTSSGTFSTDDLDFAAAAGPVEGLSGTIAFTDLLNLVTAPHQVLKIGSFNPGIDVVDGTVDLALRPGGIVQLNAASWPFDGGTLRIEPAELHLGSAAPYRLELVIDGLQAPQFLQRIDMANLSATGTFDGHLPLVFDANGGRIVGGALVSRPPGGNVSYVGALTYRDLSPMANYAFRMLRSVDYATMTIGLEGDLAGEFVTRVSFGGIHQGKGAQRNLITRELAHLPLQFDVNIRSQFSQLLGSLRSLYDPSLVPDPRTLGLVDAQGRPVHRHGAVSVGPAAPNTTGIPKRSFGSDIQAPASGTMP